MLKTQLLLSSERETQKGNQVGVSGRQKENNSGRIKGQRKRVQGKNTPSTKCSNIIRFSMSQMGM
jgi:hypothetical protein